jgi:hypothetical protein
MSPSRSTTIRLRSLLFKRHPAVNHGCCIGTLSRRGGCGVLNRLATTEDSSLEKVGPSSPAQACSEGGARCPLCYLAGAQESSPDRSGAHGVHAFMCLPGFFDVPSTIRHRSPGPQVATCAPG